MIVKQWDSPDGITVFSKSEPPPFALRQNKTAPAERPKFGPEGYARQKGTTIHNSQRCTISAANGAPPVRWRLKLTRFNKGLSFVETSCHHDFHSGVLVVF
jgi:hypothetical protein